MSRTALIHVSTIAAISIAVLLSCSASRDSEYDYIRGVLSRKGGFHLNDSIAILSIDDGGFDLHGDMSMNYKLTISENDMLNVIAQIDQDSVRKWTETDDGNLVTTVVPEDYRDTFFIIGVIKSRSLIDLNFHQGL